MILLLALVLLCVSFPLQVFATYPNEDYDRRNEDVDPMAASAEYELEKRVERLDLFPVELEKGPKTSHLPPQNSSSPPRSDACTNILPFHLSLLLFFLSLFLSQI